MTHLVRDRVKETTTTTGTGDITLAGAVTQFKAFSAAFELSKRISYAIVGQTGSEWEVGVGYLSGSSTLVRETVQASSNSDALVNFSSGTKDVFCTLGAELVTSRGHLVAKIAGNAMA